MKQTLLILKFWVISAVCMILADLYFEYIVNRDEVPEFLVLMLSIPMLIITVLYIKYFYKTIIKLLKL